MPLAPSYRGRYQLTPDDEESLIGSVANVGLSGLAMMGNAIDLPSSILRDALTWLPGGRQDNPFDQLLSPLSDTGRTSGRDLLSDWGWANKNKETGIGGWLDDPMEGVRDVGGLGLELVLDPLLPLSGGSKALSKVGRVLQDAGVLGDIAGIAAKKAKQATGSVGPRAARMSLTAGDIADQSGRAADAILGMRPPTLKPAKGVFDPADLLLTKAEREAPIGALATYNLPFMDPILMGTGPTAMKLAQKLDKYSLNPFDLGSKWANGPTGMTAKALFKASSMGRATPEVGAHAEQLFDKLGRAKDDSQTWLADVMLKAHRAGVDPEKLRAAAEGIPGDYDEVTAALGADIFGKMKEIPEFESAAAWRSAEWKDKHAGYTPRTQAQIAADEEKTWQSGSPLGAPGDPQHREKLFGGFPGGTEQINRWASDPTLHALADAGREAIKKGTLKKAAVIDDMAKTMRADPRYQNIDAFVPNTKPDGTYLFTGKGTPSVAGGTRTVPFINVKPFEWNPKVVDEGTWVDGQHWLGHHKEHGFGLWEAETTDHYKGLAEWLFDHPEFKDQGLFPKHVAVESAQRLEKAYRRDAITDQAMQFGKEYAGPSSKFAKDEGVALGDVFERLGMDRNAALEMFARRRGDVVPLTKDEILKEVYAGRMTNVQADAALKDITTFQENMRDIHVSKKLADDYLKPTWNPSLKGTPLEPLGKKLDSFTSLFKSGVLSWPSTKVRDLTSGQIASVLEKMIGGESSKATAKIMAGETPAGLVSRNPEFRKLLEREGVALTDDAAADWLRTQYAGRSSGSVQATAGDLLSRGGNGPQFGLGMEQLLERVPGAQKKSLSQATGDLLETALGRSGDTTLNPRKAKYRGTGINITPDQIKAGVDVADKSTWGPIAAMEKLGNFTDTANRLNPFIHEVLRGVDPAEAMRRINQIQVNYDPRNFTGFERGLKKLLPFYSFQKGMMPYVGKTLSEAPGGRMAQTIRAINEGRSEDATLPAHIAQQASIPLGGGTDGSKRYLQGLSTMFESPLNMLGNPLLSSGAMLNPLVKAPIELMTGKSLFQAGPEGARDLAEMDPLIGRVLANVTGQKDAVRLPRALEVAAANSPLSKLLSTLRVATESSERKGAGAKVTNLLTGFKAADVSPAAQDAVLRDLVSNIMKEQGAGSFDRVFFSKEEIAAMPPSQRDDALKMNALLNTLAKRAKERKKDKANAR